MGKVISVANQKGGVGKTTTAVNLSALLAKKGKKVLLIDTDPQGNATSGVGVDKTVSFSVYDVLVDDVEIEKIKNDYDYVIIDCPPSLGLVTLNAFTASDSVLIPIQCEYYALEGLGQLINTINLVKKRLNKELVIEGALLAMYDARTNLSNQVVKEVKNYFDDKVYKTVIPRNVKLSEAPSYGMPICMYDARSKGSRCYDKFAKEFIKKNEDLK